MSTTQVFLGAFAVLAALPVLTLLAGNRKSLAGSITLVGVGVACLAMLGLAVTALTVGPIAFDLGTVPLFGLTSSLAFTIDGLSAIFVILISVLGTASALYSVGYIAHYPDEDARRYYVPFPLFIAGMLMVATTSDWFCFFFGWEFMTLVSYFLVTFENRDKENLSAGFIYFFMTQLTSMGLMLAIIVLGTWGGSTSFAAVAKTLGALQAENPVALYGLLSLFFIGFATKAGMFPLGIWLPKAHPAAPASVSALLSGVMIKLGIYGMLRIFLWALPLGEATHVWGMVITLFGVLSMLVGTLRALGEHDCKRLLAQHSIGQMGYVLLGLGLGLTFLGSNPLFAALGFLGCLYHLINHACFKSLLFFNTGSILYRAGTRDLDSLGGLSAVMPLTAGCALVGALSIAGTPPFNGFVSKWLLYQSAIFGDVSTPVYILAAVVAIFIGTVTLASFVKYMGTAYLGTLPKRFVGSGFGCPRSMEAVEVFLAVVCLVMGVFPGPVVATLLGVLDPAFAGAGVDLGPSVLSALPWSGLSVTSASGTTLTVFAPLVVIGGLAVSFALSALIHGAVKVPSRPAQIWNCGEEIDDELVRYRASSFYSPFKKLIAPVYRQHPFPTLSLPALLPRLLDLDKWLYFPIGALFRKSSKAISRAHTGVPQLYLSWQVAGGALAIVFALWLM